MTRKKFDRKKAKDAIAKRTQESYNRREGAQNNRYFDPELDLPLWTASPTKQDPHIADIIPFLAGKNYPIVDKKNITKEGDYTYLLEIYVHQGIGPENEWVVCPLKNYQKPCPICEDFNKQLKNGAEWDDVKEFAPKRRCVYNIIIYDDEKQEKEGIKIWEVSYKYSEQPIQLAAKSPRGGGIVPFADPDVGKSISFEVANDDYKTHQGHKLVDRDYKISDEILDSTYTLDETIEIKEYDEIYKIFHMTDPVSEEEQQEETTKSRRRPNRQRAETEAETEVESEKELECPIGGEFGKDIDLFEDCDDCDVYDECAEKAEEIEKEKKQRRSKKLRK